MRVEVTSIAFHEGKRRYIGERFNYDGKKVPKWAKRIDEVVKPKASGKKSEPQVDAQPKGEPEGEPDGEGGDLV